MNEQITRESLMPTFDDFMMEACDVMHTLAILRTYGFDLEQRESIIATWESARAINRGAQSNNELTIELYAKVEAMVKVNPIIQTLKNIHVKMMIITNQAHGIASLLIPFAGPYSDIPTTSELESIASAIDDLPLAFVEHFAAELDVLRWHSETTAVWLNALKPDDPDEDFDEIVSKGPKRLDELEPRETAGPKIYWECKWCGMTNHDINQCECGGYAPWVLRKNRPDDEEKLPI